MQNLFLRFKHSAPLIMGVAVGAIAWSGHVYTLPFILALPLLLIVCASFLSRILLVAGYHAGATWTLLPGAHLFFGHQFRPLDTLFLWTAWIIVLTLPWIFLKCRTRFFYWGLPAALLLSAALPTGIANPLTSAGALFPGTSWVGLLFILVAFGALPILPKQTLVAVAVFALICNLTYKPPQAPATWIAINTRYGGAGFGILSGQQQYENAIDIQAQVLRNPARVLLFPESSVYRWNDATDLFWNHTLQQLGRDGRTILLGAGRSLPASRQFHNVIIVRGTTSAEYIQHFPMPYGMWKPFSTNGVPLRFAGPYTIEVDGQNTAPLICYEQLLIFPVLRAMIHSPTLLLAISNDYWAKGTSIPQIQNSAVSSWSRLFAIPYLSAVNE